MNFGWATRIRTWTNASKGHCPTIRRSPNTCRSEAFAPAEGEFLSHNGSLSTALLAASISRQYAARGRVRVRCLRNSGSRKRSGSLRISAGLVQPEERRTGPGQRSMEGCLRCAGAARMRLISAKGGCWGKTTRSKSFWIQFVIPVRTSADSCGPARSSPIGEDTGGACSLPTLRKSSRKGAGIGTTQLLQFSLTCLRGQTFRGAEGVPVAKCLGRGDANRRAQPPRTRRARCRAAGKPPDLDRPRGRCHQSRRAAHRNPPGQLSEGGV